jgi:hypothetical protein
MRTTLLLAVLFTGCVHGALRVSSGPGGPWIVTEDGAIYARSESAWVQKEAPGSADDLALCGASLFILTRPDAQGLRSVKSRDVYSTAWTTYPAIGAVGLSRVACDGHAAVVLTASPDMSVYRYDGAAQRWASIHSGATEISVMNGRLFYLYPTTTNGNVWSRNVLGGPYERWGDPMVAQKIAGDANGYPWIATSATSNPLFKWDTKNQKWTFGFASGPVYDMDVESYVRMYMLSDPAVGGGYTLYSHELYSGGWTKYDMPTK